MSPFTLKFYLGLAVWSGLLLGSLSVASVPGDWGHGICGPWGCAAQSQSLVACHVGWLIALAPLGMFLMRRSTRTRLRAGLLLAVISILALVLIVVHQRVT